MANNCSGNAADHCCWFDGQVCTFLEENTVPGRRWACGLLRVTGSWESAMGSQEFTQVVLPKAIAAGLDDTYTCADWPPAGGECATCGAKG